MNIIETDIGALNRRLVAMQREITALRSERRAGATTINGDLTIGSGGTLTVDGGDFLLLDTDASTVFRLGPQPQGDRGVSIYRDDGSIALEVRKPFSPTDTPLIRIFDAAGNTLFGEETLGNGLNRPYLPMPMQPVAAVTPNAFGWSCSTSSASFVDLFRWQGSRQNQWCRPVFNMKMSDGSTAAEIRVVNEVGVVIAPFLAGGWVGSVAAGSAADQEVKPPGGLRLTSAFGVTQVLRVQARRTAGAGTVETTVKVFEGGSA